MLIASAALVATLGWYAVLCAVKPFAPCRRCQGTGKTLRFGKPKTCRRCRGHKLRLRIGRRLHNASRRTYDAGTR
jgi:DnaJ-class molecular chaperone